MTAAQLLPILVAWSIAKTAAMGITVIPDTTLAQPVRVNRDTATIWIRPDLPPDVFHYWTTRAIAFIELGPEVVRDFVPPGGNVIPLRGRR